VNFHPKIAKDTKMKIMFPKGSAALNPSTFRLPPSAFRLLPALGLLSSLAGLLLIAGCNIIPPPQADPTRFYTLAGPGLAGVGATQVHGSLRLGLKAVDVPPYLKKGVFVVRRGENELVYNDYARWAEPLDVSIGRLLRTRLATDAKVARVFTAPFSIEEERDFDVTVTIVRCEGVQEGSRAVARFGAVVEVTSVGVHSEVVARKTFTAPDAAWDGKDYAALARILSDDVAALSQEVAAALPEKK
jgi:uncharacterized protein